ncbi:cytochrome P450 [Aspergillus affinis]|uniref:cytochrome P450 n=1 Tax=Aspergillus affinis TaxID=1070780 RepID=UPI0022FE789F|nr:putative cytochrome P450 monooxygenase [Aspergillus affinis]KAI9045920.1 putative cytochrome P450 monooxygenase [Aspergillus affinis]
MILYSLFLGLLALYIVGYVRRLVTYTRRIRPLKLPYIVALFSDSDLPVIILYGSNSVRYAINHWLPGWLSDRLNEAKIISRWSAKDRMAKRLGGVFFRVTPKGPVGNVSDASVTSQIFGNRGDFPKPTQQYGWFNVLGAWLVEGKEWQHHRRHTATTFNEKNNALVWKEAIHQTTQMIEHWQETSPTATERDFLVERTREDGLKLTLNILSGAGFGVPIPFKPVQQGRGSDSEDIFKDSSTPPAGFDYTFSAAIAYVSIKIITVILAYKMIPRRLPRQLVPSFLREKIAAYRDLDAYLHKLVVKSKASVQHSDENAGNLVHGMLLSQMRGDQDGGDKGLTDVEIMGNMFIFAIAGHETTATTFRYALLLLALHQDVQDWLYEGVLEATRDEPVEVSDWDHDRLFPKLITPLCVMLETLRLYPPVITIPKWTGYSPSTITYHGQDYIIPPKTNININVNVLHLSEEYWGPDAKHFHPQRWDASNQDSFLAKNADTPGLVAAGLELPTIHRPVRGAYVPFSDGVRACLGKKFAQVEFVAALAVIVKQFRVELAEDSVEFRRNAERVLEGGISVLTLGMEENVPLRLCRR